MSAVVWEEKKLSANFILGTSNDKLLITFFSERKICQKNEERKRKKNFSANSCSNFGGRKTENVFITFCLFQFVFFFFFIAKKYYFFYYLVLLSVLNKSPRIYSLYNELWTKGSGLLSKCLLEVRFYLQFRDCILLDCLSFDQ